MLITSIVAVAAVLAALCGPASSRRPRIGIPAAAALTLGSAVAAVATWVYTVPLLGAVVAVPALCGAVLLAANVRGALRSPRLSAPAQAEEAVR